MEVKEQYLSQGVSRAEMNPGRLNQEEAGLKGKESREEEKWEDLELVL